MEKGRIYYETPAGNYAVMLYKDSALTLTNGIAANDAGVGYTVAFLAAPAVYDTSSQAKAAVDAMLVQVLRGDGSVLTFWVCNPGAWADPPAWQSFSFKYVGDGTGAVPLRVNSLYPTDGYFAGAIDNLRVATDYMPTPSPTNITYTVSGNQMVLNGPAGQGWLLESNSVSVAASGSWFSVSGAAPPFVITMNRTNPSVFYRLKY
jgi:hypothetical protein